MNRTDSPKPEGNIYTAGAIPYLHIPALLLAVFAVQAEIQAPGYTEEQATRGKAAYAIHCAACHGANLNDGQFAPALKGGTFIQNWGSRSLDKIFIKTVSSMPTAAPNSLGDETYSAILAYLLKRNGVSATLLISQMCARSSPGMWTVRIEC